MEEIALIVAGGEGQRMQSSIPKQFQIVVGLPVVMHTINAFRNYRFDIPIILVLPPDQMDVWDGLIHKYNFENVQSLVNGGNTRFQSVKNGLRKVEDTDIVAIHDGVRPLVTTTVIDNTFRKAKESGSAIPCVKLKDSLRKILAEGSSSRKRSEYVFVQTPQTFSGKLIKDAYNTEELSEFTDDASVLEKSGYPIQLVDGDSMNIKITTTGDLSMVEFYMNQKFK